MRERFKFSGGKRLRCGYTTGSCAAAAAACAVRFIITGQLSESETLILPSGETLEIPIKCGQFDGESAICEVIKDAGDDIDVTNEMVVCAKVCLTDNEEIKIDGGIGIGRITREGLDQPVGEAAINSVPRRMITASVRAMLSGYGELRGADVIIFIPDGEWLSTKTYNSRLGIVGGLSVLGTTGIVEPMSEMALIDTIHKELDMLRAESNATIIMTPGNYGETFCRDILDLPLNRCVLCSNFLGESLDYVNAIGFKNVLLVGHIGKLVKTAGGIFQTHSHVADGRMEILTAHAAMAGAKMELCAELMECVTTDAALEILENAELLREVMDSIMQKLEFHVSSRVRDLPVGVVVFSNGRGVLGMTDEAYGLIKQIQKQNKE